MKKSKNVIAWIVTAMLTLLTFSGCMPDMAEDISQSDTVVNLMDNPAEAVMNTEMEFTDRVTESVTTAEETAAETMEIAEANVEESTAAISEMSVAANDSTPENSTFSIHFIDVGQADAALIECDGHYMLIDGGNKADSNLIYSVLKKAEVPKLDIIVGTHAHEDHIGGLPGALNYTTADLVISPVTDYDSEAFADYKKYADKNGGGTCCSKGRRYIQAGQRRCKNPRCK